MKVIIGSDHGGYGLKEKLKEYLASKGIDLEDMGTNSEESCDYPDYAAKAAKKVQETGNTGILVCGTGIGMSMAANKFKGIRAALCYDEYTARMAREHNDANILCLGERTTKDEDAKKIVDVFLATDSSKEERHKRRVNKISDIGLDS
ncbi:MAG: ribose 5-phosphate isomerase B [Nanoarchaeota archaeon]|nr:ribose 5-phosphate isomerase B [Nanoarchaeota archaeon]